MLRRIGLGLALAALLLALGCTGGEDDGSGLPGSPVAQAATATLTPSPSPTPTPTALERLRAAGDVMRETTSFHFNLQYEGQRGTPILEGMELVSAEGDLSAGDVQMTAGVRMPDLNLYVEQKVVSTEGRTFLSDPLSDRWSEVPPEQVPCVLNDLNERIGGMVEEAERADVVGEERVSGREALRLRAALPGESFAAMVCSQPGEEEVEADVWLDSATGHMLKVYLEGRVAPGEPEGLTRTLTLSSFGERVVIEAPEP